MLVPGSMAFGPDEDDRQKGAQTVHPLPEVNFYGRARRTENLSCGDLKFF